jgi:hypothetical protein
MEGNELLAVIEPRLSIETREIAQSRNTPRLSMVDAKEKKQLAAGIILEAAATVGQKNIDPDVTNVCVRDLLDLMESKYRGWSVGEFQLAIRKGARGELGVAGREEVCVSSRAIYKWLNAYSENERREANKEIARAAQALSDEPNTDMSMPEKIQYLDTAYINWSQGTAIGLLHVYDILKSLDKLPTMSNEQKWDVCREAIANCRREWSAHLSTPLRHEAKIKLEEIGNIQAGKWASVPEHVVFECLRVIVMRWFSDLKAVEIKPSDLLAENKAHE